ncbi:MAG TPA: hypothetical protein ENN29_06865 [Candidatus Hydrogenedentes bacterium]|nr:hypothetical protein [Candidatus Hydrogenedentota bacterium]
MLDIDTSSRTEQRKFGLMMAAAIIVIGLIRFALHGFAHFPVWFFVVAGAFACFGLLLPRALQPVFVVWIKFALVLNWLVTHLMLTVMYWLIIVPMGVVMRLFSEDPLKRKWLPKTDSYWEAPEEQPEEFERWRNQF